MIFWSIRAKPYIHSGIVVKCLTKGHECSPDNWTKGTQYYKRTTQFIQESSTSSYDLNQIIYINIESGKMADNHLVKTTIYHRHWAFPFRIWLQVQNYIFSITVKIPFFISSRFRDSNSVKTTSKILFLSVLGDFACKSWFIETEKCISHVDLKKCYGSKTWNSCLLKIWILTQKNTQVGI